jgi:uracil-DNA glycosylase
MNNKTRKFYVGVMNCEYTNDHCPQAWKDISLGLIPRAFTPCKSRQASILVVAKNPGHPLDGERAYFRSKTGEDLLSAKEKFDLEKHERIRMTTNRSLRYHKNLRRYLRYFLGISSELETYEEYQRSYCAEHEKEIFQHVALTNLFKCSTEGERERIRSESLQTCYDKYLSREIELWRPKVILALGEEVSGFLEKKNLIVPLVSVRHPSYFYRKADERRILSIKKKKLAKILTP